MFYHISIERMETVQTLRHTHTHTHATTIITIESLVCFGRIQTEAIHSCDRIGVDGVSGEVLIV